MIITSATGLGSNATGLGSMANNAHSMQTIITIIDSSKIMYSNRLGLNAQRSIIFNANSIVPQTKIYFSISHSHYMLLTYILMQLVENHRKAPIKGLFL